jgi:hypothetical protein
MMAKGSVPDPPGVSSPSLGVCTRARRGTRGDGVVGAYDPTPRAWCKGDAWGPPPLADRCRRAEGEAPPRTMGVSIPSLLAMRNRRPTGALGDRDAATKPSGSPGL